MDLCDWCSDPKVADLVIKKPTKSKPMGQLAAACDYHVKHFNKQGILTREQESRARNTSRR